MAASKLVLYDRPDTFHSTGDYYGLDGVPNSRGVWQLDTGQYDREEGETGELEAHRWQEPGGEPRGETHGQRCTDDAQRELGHGRNR